MHAHAADFRSEVRDGDAAALSEALLHDWRRAPLSRADRALCAFAEDLAGAPGRMREEDLLPLRDAGLDDRSIHDAVQAVAYFCYINRVAEGLGVDLEPGMPPRPSDRESEEQAIFAAGEAMGMERAYDTASITISWECTRCRRIFPAGKPLPPSCDACGTPRTEFVPFDGR